MTPHLEDVATPDFRLAGEADGAGVLAGERVVNTGADIYKVAFAPDGSALASYSSRTDAISVWGPETLEKRGEFVVEIPVSSYADAIVLDDGRLTVNGFKRRAAWDVATGAMVEQLPMRPKHLTVSRDGRVSAAVVDGRARVWRTEDDSELFLAPTEEVTLAAVGPRGERLAVASDWESGGRVEIWDVASGALLAEVRYPRATFTLMAFSESGARLALGAYTGRVVVWDLAANQRMYSLQAGDGLRALGVSPDGRFVATGGSEPAARRREPTGVAALWELETGALALVRRFEERVSAAPFSADGRWWAMGAWDGSLAVVELR